MTAPTPTRQLASVVLMALCLVLATPVSALAEEGATPKYTKENREAFEQQLAKGEVKSAEFNKKLRSLHIITKNGTLYLFHYEKKGAPEVQAKLKAHHVTYTILAPTAAAKEASTLPKHTKHKIRYIVGGAVVLLIVVGALVYFLRRRSMRD